MENQSSNTSPQLVMFLDSLHNLPALNIPEDYQLRSFCPGDEKEWENIINASFNTQSDFERDIMSKEYFKPERVKFICWRNKPIATATAWESKDFGKETGYLHMVGILPEHSGKRLGYQVCLAALHHMALEGKSSAVLHTDDFRLPAIKTYWNLGFKPMLVHENQVRRWYEVSLKLNLPQLNDELIKTDIQ
ncbi:MAG: GNAT family N-acetyltransferase [Clostridiales bacterium]|mgnify:CR=1 FL=1|jgi:mycothiol synthase|nr:GNAT family N-acetyltransferase [Clostridiales bacterium]